MRNYSQLKKQLNLTQKKTHLVKIASNIEILTNCVNAITRLKKLKYRT